MPFVCRLKMLSTTYIDTEGDLKVKYLTKERLYCKNFTQVSSKPTPNTSPSQPKFIQKDKSYRLKSPSNLPSLPFQLYIVYLSQLRATARGKCCILF